MGEIEQMRDIHEQVEEARDLTANEILAIVVDDMKERFPKQTKKELREMAKASIVSYPVLEEIEQQIIYYMGESK